LGDVLVYLLSKLKLSLRHKFGIAFEILYLSFAAVTAVISLFWSIKELHEQEERVRKNWFPANPKNKYHAEKQNKDAFDY
jgi:hypothetical protein